MEFYNMKKCFLICLIAVMILPMAITSNAQIKREHRSAWVSPYVGDWPSSPIIESNIESSKKACTRMLDSLQVNNFNTLYYHVRFMCDAMYNSAYEPWAEQAAGTRGKAPAFDTFEFLVAEAHARGLEVYAWLNPYRYANDTNMWGQSDRDYVNTHPEWLVTNSAQTCLNPGLPEVIDRIEGVCRDIIDKYDIDGLVFDDYFYNAGGLDLSADADLYGKYVAAGGKLSQGDWRRENVNTMVRGVNSLIKSTKPYIRFGISPAGGACTNATSAKKYGLPSCPASDWQYNGIYSDPIAWMKEGTIDFISPQIYWPVNGTNDFEAVTKWWSNVAKLFNRHLYVSQSTDALKNTNLNEFTDEINITRNSALDASPGMVYFSWKSLNQQYIKIDNRFVYGPHFLKRYSFQHKSLTPAVTWLPGDKPNIVNNLAKDDTKISWTGANNLRYIVYAVPSSVAIENFHCEAEYILGITYVESYSIPADKAEGYKYAVSALDRYGNEGSAIFVGEDVKDAPVATLISPAAGEIMHILDSFSWESNATQFIVEVSKDADMKNVLTSFATDMKTLPISQLCKLESGVKYYWQVTSRLPNCRDSHSTIGSFISENMEIVSPENGATDVNLAPTINWTTAGPGVSYLVEVAKSEGMSDLVFSQSTDQLSISIPEYSLCGNTDYYLRISASKNNVTYVADVKSFSTVLTIPNAPVFLNPESDGATIYSNQKIAVKPEPGIKRFRLEICATNGFSPRATYINNIDGIVFESLELSTVKISSAYLADGKTYYVRTRFDYVDEGGATVSTDYSRVATFVYNSGTGVGMVGSDGKPYVMNTIDPILVIPMANGDEIIEIYDISGRKQDINISVVVGRNEVSLASLPKGAYVININSTTKIKFIR